MPRTPVRTVVAGDDGTYESRAAAGWAADEALLRGASLSLVHARDWQPYVYAPLAGVQSPLPPRRVPPADDSDQPLLDAVRRDLLVRRPALRISTSEVPEEPVSALLTASAGAELLVLGSRRLSTVAGLLVGSVALGVVAHTVRPVVLVPAPGHRLGGPEAENPVDQGQRADGDVVLGLDTRHPAEPAVAFAFEAAALRGVRLRVIRCWTHPALHGDEARTAADQAARARHRLTDALAPWRDKYPGVDVAEETVTGRAAAQLVAAAHDAALLVVGRRNRSARTGGHVGPVTHTVLHHSDAPVAVVPHD
jgi:nucleotide-binding universal stress UspA family protein